MALGRKAKWTLVSVASLALLFALIHTPPAKELVRRVVTRVASSAVGGPVSIGALDYELWRARVTVETLELEPDIMVVPFELTADRIDVYLAFPLKLSGTLDNAELVFIDFFETPSADYTPMLQYIGTLSVANSAVRFRDHDDEGELDEWIAVEGIDIDLLEPGAEHRAIVHAREGQAFGIPFGAIDADLYVSPGRLRAVSASLFKDDSFVRASGELDVRDELAGDLDVSFALDGQLARLIDDELDLTGIVSGESRIELADGAASIDSELRAPTLSWHDVGVEDVVAEAAYAGGILTLGRLEASGFGGRATLGAEVGFTEESLNRFDLSWSDIEAADVVDALSDETLPFAARVRGDATLSVRGTAWETAEARASADIAEGSDVTGGLDAALDSGIVSLSTRALSIPALGASIDAEGTVSTSGELDVDVVAAVSNVDTLYESSPVSVLGSIDARGSLVGTLDEPLWNATLSRSVLEIEGEPYTLSGELTGTDSVVALEEVVLGGALTVATARGVIPLGSEGNWDVDVALAGALAGDVRVAGERDDPDAAVEATYATDALGRYRLVARKRGQVIHLEELGVSLDGGIASAEGTYELDTDVINASFTLQELRPRAPTDPDCVGVDAVINGSGSLSGTLGNIDGAATVSIDELTYECHPLPPLDLTVEARGERARLLAARRGGAEAPRRGSRALGHVSVSR